MTEPGTPLSHPLTGWRRLPFARAMGLYVAVRLITLAMVLVNDAFTNQGLVAHLSTWDGAWFLQAVRHGWPSHLPHAQGHVLANPIAFFPLFPLAIRAVAAVTTLSAAVVGIWLSAVAGLTAVVGVGLLTAEFTDRDRGERAALLFALAPGSFVFNLIYNDGLLITFCALSLWALLRRRWRLAGVIGVLATATSPVGLILALSCVVSAGLAIARRREWRALAAPLLAPLGFFAWMGYLWAHTGEPWAWRITEHDGWQSYPSLLYPLRVLAKFITNPLSPTMTGQILFAGTVVAVALLVVAFREHQPIELLTFATGALVLFAVSAPVGLRPRFIMLAFPLTIAAATRWSGRRFQLVLTTSAILLALMTIESFSSFAVFP